MVQQADSIQTGAALEAESQQQVLKQQMCIRDSFKGTKVQKYLQKHAISSKKDNVSIQKSQQFN